MFLESWGAIATGWVRQVFIDTPFTFTFIGFEWLGFLHGELMYGYYILMGVAGLSVMLGFRYRFSSMLLLIMWTATYLVQKTNYNNHYYLGVLFCAFMVVVPAHEYFSVDSAKNPTLVKNTCPRWAILIFPLQVAIVYFYAAIAKMYPDWLRLEPISIFLSAKSNYFLIGGVLQQEWMAFFISYGGILFDALIIPGLLWQKTRKWAFGISIFFHLFNSIVFQVGIFPYLMLAITVFFFPVSEVKKVIFKRRPEINKIEASQPSWIGKIWMIILLSYFTLQIFLPLRHHMFEGNVNWTEEGHRMSWRMMLRAKSGSIDFRIVDTETGETQMIHPGNHISPKQSRAMAGKPDMIWQFVQYLKRENQKPGGSEISIYANSRVHLNHRKSGPLISPQVDLSAVEWEPFHHAEWLMPVPGY